MSPEPLQVDQRVEGTAMILRAVGEVDAASVAVLSDQLVHAVEAVTAPGPVVLDLRAVEFLGSAGMAMLIAIHHRCQDQRVGFRVLAGPFVTRRLELLGLLNFLIVCRTLDHALHGTGSDLPAPVT